MLWVSLAFFAAMGLEAEDQSAWKLKPALLVMDIQNAFLPEMSAADRELAPKMVNYAIQIFRKFGLPVIRIYHSEPNQGPNPGTKEFEFSQDIEISNDMPQIVKNYGNAFKKTDLEKMIDEKGINTLFICGLSATGCVLATWHGAQDLNYNAFLVQDALYSPNAAHTRVIQEIIPTIHLNALFLMLAGMAR